MFNNRKSRKNSTGASPNPSSDEVDIDLRDAGNTAAGPVAGHSAAPSSLRNAMRRRQFHPGTDELVHYLDAVLELELAAVLANHSDENGLVEVDVTLYADDVEVTKDHLGDWWVCPPYWSTVEHVEAHSWDEIRDVLTDSRWGTHQARGLCVRRVDGGESCDGMRWFFQFSDHLLGASVERFAFILDGEEDTTDADPELNLLTPRTRLVLWLSLQLISEDLRAFHELAGIVGAPQPFALVGEQSNDWWARLCKSADRLQDAARRGAPAELKPRTPAEEVLLAVAMAPDHIEQAWSDVNERGLNWLHDQLDLFPADESWVDLLAQLVDVDIATPQIQESARQDDGGQVLRAITDRCPPAWWHGGL